MAGKIEALSAVPMAAVSLSQPPNLVNPLATPSVDDPFTSTGLLGGASDGPQADYEMADADDIFVSTGLLGGVPAESEAFAPNGLLAEGPSGEGWSSNGLLGAEPSHSSSGEGSAASGIWAKTLGAEESSLPAVNLDAGSNTVSETSPVPNELAHPPASPSADAWASNGLLGSGASPPLTQSQDDAFPEVSDLLRPNSKPAGAHAPPTSVHQAPVFMTRAPLRVSSYSGREFTLRRKVKRTARNALEGGPKIGTLLDVPIHRLLDELSIAAATKLSLSDVPVPAHTHKSTQPADASLWVDRYRPERFTDLLGDERVHRETLAWVKGWDFCVFGRRRAVPKRARPGDADADDRDAQGGEWKEDTWKRPKEKILLMSGPPGLGKTTLAHVVARQAGYDVFEVNASDARSGSIVDDRIRPALEAGSAVGSSRPYLVVVDEIDGATGAGDNASGFIQKLVELTQDRPRKKSRNKGGPATSAERPLLRPIICICNDLYAAALAKLRPHAQIVRFARPADVHIVRRLRTICEAEALRADARALTTLVGVARGDWRGCLNVLQMLKARNQEVTEKVVRTATAGMKEADAGFLTVLNNLFAPMTRKRVKELGMGEEEETRFVTRLSREIDASGVTDKLALGCFEHYATLRRHDASFARYAKGTEWLGAFDMFSGAMRSEREYALLPYLAYTLVPFYPLFQERGGTRVERPKADWENFVATRTNEEIYRSLGRSLRAASGATGGDFRHFAGSESMLLEFAPLINRIIAPPLRPVNSQVTKPEEKALLGRLVDIMVSLELRFVQERGEDGQLVYRLEPPLDVFVTYDGKRASDILISRYAVRHIVAGEIDAKSISRHAAAIDRGPGKAGFFKKAAKDVPENGVEDGKGDPEAPAEEGTLARATDAPDRAVKRARTDKTDIADRPPTDFFGRPLTHLNMSTKDKATSARKILGKQPRVAFKFNEGNSAAVRKPVKVSAFM